MPEKPRAFSWWHIKEGEGAALFGFEHPGYDDSYWVVEPLYLRSTESNWQDIGTAPKTGEEFIARTGPEWSSFSCFWDGVAFVHFDKDDGFIRYSPTEWMPFPSATEANDA